MNRNKSILFIMSVAFAALVMLLVSTTGFWNNEYFAVYFKPTCFKPVDARGYKICDELPYTEINCGNSEVGRSSKRFLVPNEIVFIWFAKNKSFEYYNYLALRSVASIQNPNKIKVYYSSRLPSGKYWERTMVEIPCLEFIQIKEPSEVFGVEMPDVMRRTDLARINVMIKSGGVYLDGDVITLKNFDSLRIYPTTLGRSTKFNVCVCVILAEKGSIFLKEFRKQFPYHFQMKRPAFFTTKYLGKFASTSFEVRIEESSINRPNPHVKEDGILSTTMDRIDISENYFLHIHPRRVIHSKFPACLKMEDDELRILDTVYGEAARIALFGSSDLIFKPGEKIFEMKEKRKLVTFPSIRDLIDSEND
ncbi:uncharacterized protein LOC143449646 [Clavelina lepadiformis]|uniref:uncharacterized protein LOC143449646 n=1 Tax=Clavelina lepadiformis TaxID=159417 RepID=UPI0040425058